MKYEVLSDNLMELVARRTDVNQILNFAEEHVGNPMAVGRTDMKIIYVSKGMPKDSIIAKPGMMQGYNNEILLQHMQNLEEKDEPVFLDDKSSTGKDNYQTILAPIRIQDHLVGYLSIRSVNRPHCEEDLRAAKIIASALVLLFKITANPNFRPGKDVELLLEALLEKRDVDFFAVAQLQESLKSSKGPMWVLTCRFRKGNKANAVPGAVREELCNLLKTDIYVSQPGQLVIISMVNVIGIRDEIERALLNGNLLMGVSYDCAPDVYNIYPAYYQSVAALKLVAKEQPCVFLLQNLPEFFMLKEVRYHNFNNMVHPAALMLREYDEEHGTSLCKTISIYLENKQSIKATADILGVHVNTINQRFQQISNLLVGFKFCSDSLFDFYLSLSRK